MNELTIDDLRLTIAGFKPRDYIRPPSQSFGSIFQSVKSASERESVQHAASQLVASALVLPALHSLQESQSRLKAPFAPGSTERRFAPLLYQHFADRVTESSGFDLVDTIVKRFAGEHAQLQDG